jgi:hypothetical protein
MVNNDLGLAEISKQILLWNHMYRSEYTVKLWEYSLDDHPPSILGLWFQSEIQEDHSMHSA